MEGKRQEPYVAERRVVLVPRNITGETRTPLEFPTMARAAAFLQGCMVTSRRDGRSWFGGGQ